MTRILAFRIGNLGDTVVATPALRAIRRHFPGGRVSLLCDRQVGTGYVGAADLLRGSGLVDEFVEYPYWPGSPLRTKWGMLLLSVRLRARRFDALAYLAPTGRTEEQIRRDLVFFRATGIRTVLGADGFPSIPGPTDPKPLPTMPHEADLLLERLRRSGVRVPEAGAARLELGLGAEERASVDRWREGAGSDGERGWIAVGPGSKMPAKLWPESRFAEVVARLIESHDVWPVVFGGPEEREIGRRLVAGWGRGFVAAGELGLRSSASALSRCALYLGNDTGTMHLAAAVGVRCVALFSARAPAGQWYPYGPGHRVFRESVDCEGCQLVVCTDRELECLMRIETGPVLAACRSVLAGESL